MPVPMQLAPQLAPEQQTPELHAEVPSHVSAHVAASHRTGLPLHASSPKQITVQLDPPHTIDCPGKSHASAPTQNISQLAAIEQSIAVRLQPIVPTQFTLQGIPGGHAIVPSEQISVSQSTTQVVPEQLEHSPGQMNPGGASITASITASIVSPLLASPLLVSVVGD